MTNRTCIRRYVYLKCLDTSQNVRIGETITNIFSFYTVTFTKGDYLQLHADISPPPVVNVSNAYSNNKLQMKIALKLT
jgi:hypothetical protein